MDPGQSPRPAARTLALLAGLFCFANAAWGGGTHDPNRTATIYVHGFDPDGASQGGVYGHDVLDPLLDDIADLEGLPTINQPGGITKPNVIAATTYYGDTPPPYYTAQDIADIAAVTAQWGGGIPRYALIVAKYAKRLMELSGAQQVNFVSASMGSFVTRWLIEKNVEGLAADGRIARWLSLEGVISGNWAASRNELTFLWDLFGTPTIDVDQMDYGWIEQYLHAPRWEADNPLLASILIGQTASTSDTANEGALTAAMLLFGEFQPNDGVQGVYDAYFQSVTAPSRYLGLSPTLTHHHVNHYELADHQGAWAQAVCFITQKRRVTVTLIRAQVTDIHEPDLPLWDWTPAEIVFQSRVYSPLAASRWGIVDPLSSRHRVGASSPIVDYDFNGQEHVLDQVIFDDLVLDTETQLDLELWAEEIDWDVRYGVTEPLVPPSYDDLGGNWITVPITGPGTFFVDAPDWNADLAVEVFDYPFQSLGPLGDINGDGSVDVNDFLQMLGAWGACPDPPEPCPADLDNDGSVGITDFLILLANWS
jgi:hypothetical protein